MGYQNYTYATFPELVAALLLRLDDAYVGYTSSTGAGFVSPVEAALYVTEALQTLNAQASVWPVDFVLDWPAGGPGWQSVPAAAGSPRARTTTDESLYTLMAYHLLEPPPAAGVWQGTTQYTLQSLSDALQYRMDELLQVSGANVQNLLQASPTAGYRTTLPDATLALRRVRWAPAVLSGAAAYPLSREDRITTSAYGQPLTTETADPDSYMLTANAPLQFDVNTVPSVPGQWDMLVLAAGPTLAPPAPTVIPLPNDWCWAAKWGALADLLGNSPEGADRQRAAYCAKRHAAGMRAMLALPWLLQATATGLSTDTPAVREMDAYAPNWEQTWPQDDPQVVVGGLDLVAVAPFVAAPAPLLSTLLTVVGNAPVDPAQPVQLARDGVEAVLAYAQHLATFKNGGDTFAATLPLLTQFESYCRRENARYAALGIARPEMLQEGGRGESLDPRYQGEAAEVEEAQGA